MEQYYGEVFESYDQNQVEDNGIVLSIDTMRGMKESEQPMVGLSWSKEVFDYMAEDMDAQRIEKFFSDSVQATSEKYFHDTYMRIFSDL